jgi:phosphoesterase RecJ-like protein
MTEANLDYTPLAEALSAASTIGVVGHVRPDGDALGSMIGLVLSARAAGKDAVASFGEPFVVGDEFGFLDLEALVPPREFPKGLDLAIVCDTSARDRVGSVVGRVESAGTVGVIDHHRTNGDFGDVTIIDSDAAATTQLVYRLLRLLDWPVTPQVATALYTGLVTDTGRFQYSSTTPEVHTIAGELIEAGAVPATVGQSLFEEVPFGYYAVVANVLGRAVLEEEIGLVWSVLYKSDVEAADIPPTATDGLIDLVRMAAEAGVACLLKETAEGVLKGSLRSRGIVDVNAIAGALGGGGHHNAAGFTIEGSPEQAIARVRELLA